MRPADDRAPRAQRPLESCWSGPTARTTTSTMAVVKLANPASWVTIDSIEDARDAPGITPWAFRATAATCGRWPTTRGCPGRMGCLLDARVEVVEHRYVERRERRRARRLRGLAVPRGRVDRRLLRHGALPRLRGDHAARAGTGRQAHPRVDRVARAGRHPSRTSPSTGPHGASARATRCARSGWT
jgi:hypothetical protein